MVLSVARRICVEVIMKVVQQEGWSEAEEGERGGSGEELVGWREEDISGNSGDEIYTRQCLACVWYIFCQRW